MIFGDVSTGAQNDLERATEIARSMVMDFGMSRLGRVTYRESRRAAFLERPGRLARRPRRTASRPPAKSTRRSAASWREALDQVRHILETRRQALVAMAERLIEQETIDNGELKRLIEANSPSPMIVPGTEEAIPSKPAAVEDPRRARPARKGRDKGQPAGPPTSFHRTGML